MFKIFFQPSPLFTKIEIAQIEKLKSQFSGRQKSKTPDGAERVGKASSNKAETIQPNDVASLEAAVAAQGDLVRKLKTSGKEKAEWQPEVAVLLDLKKKLATAQANAKEAGVSAPAKEKTPVKETAPAKNANQPNVNGPSSVSAEKLEAAVNEQVGMEMLIAERNSEEVIKLKLKI